MAYNFVLGCGGGWEVVVEKISLLIIFFISTYRYEFKSCVVYFGFFVIFFMMRMFFRILLFFRGYMSGCFLLYYRGMIMDSEVLVFIYLFV